MTREEFIDIKAPQLAFYAKAFLKEQIDFSEVQYYLWEILEQWQQQQFERDEKTDVELVFSHLLESLDKWPGWVIRSNLFLQRQIDGYCDYLTSGGRYSDNSVSISY